jgi:hypothetical protein
MLISHNNFHTNSETLTDAILQYVKSILSHQTIKAFSAEIVKMLKCAPVWINIVGIEHLPCWTTVIWHRYEQNAARPQETTHCAESSLWKRHMFQNVSHADNVKGAAGIECGDIDAMSLNAETLHGLNAGRAQIDADRVKPPLLCGEQQRSIPESHIEPRAAHDVVSDLGHHIRRYFALVFEISTWLMVSKGLGKDNFVNRRGEVTLGEDMRARVTDHPIYCWGNDRIIKRMMGAIPGSQKTKILRLADRAFCKRNAVGHPLAPFLSLGFVNVSPRGRPSLNAPNACAMYREGAEGR